MKKYIIIVLFLVALVFPSGTHAVSAMPGLRSVNPDLTKVKTPASMSAKTTDTLQTRALSEIDRRITVLTSLLTTLSNLKRVSDTQKATLSGLINTEIVNLNALKTKISTETDPALLKADKQSIVTSHRIFVLFVPQIRLLAGADALSTVATNMSEFATRLTARVNEAQAAGQNVTQMQTLLADMQAKITDANTQSLAIITAVTPLTPAGYPANLSILQTAKANLKTGTQDLKTAAADARQIISLLKALTPQTTKTGTPSALPIN